VVNANAPSTCDVCDAQWFAGRDWSELDWDEWIAHSSAFYTFTPQAFAYYLPSIMLLSASRPNDWFAPADSLLQILDRSPAVENWDAFLTTRLVGLKCDEYEAIKAWLLHLSAGSAYLDHLDRSFDTVDLLEHETERLRRVVRRSMDA
jgi:hypothetical protein